jgi:hypothetical protein
VHAFHWHHHAALGQLDLKRVPELIKIGRNEGERVLARQLFDLLCKFPAWDANDDQADSNGENPQRALEY